MSAARDTPTTPLERAEAAIERGLDATIDLGVTIERSERVRLQLERRLKIEAFFVFVTVAAFLGCLAVRFA